MTTWHDDVLTVNDASIHYLRSGGTKPTLVMLHGFTDSAQDCEMLARSLVADYDVIMVDERGHGRSSAAHADYSLANQADDIAAFINGLGLSKPAVFGHSIGAATAVQLAFQYPNLLSCVVLEDPPYRSVLTRDDHSAWRASLTAFKQRPHDEQLAEAMRDQAHWHPDENASWVTSKNQFDLALFDAPIVNSGFDWRSVVSHITIPGLLLIGDADHGAIVTPEVAQEMKTLWPTLTVAHIEQAGHSIRRDQPVPFTETVKQYLQSQFA